MVGSELGECNGLISWIRRMSKSTGEHHADDCEGLGNEAPTYGHILGVKGGTILGVLGTTTTGDRDLSRVGVEAAGPSIWPAMQRPGVAEAQMDDQTKTAHAGAKKV